MYGLIGKLIAGFGERFVTEPIVGMVLAREPNHALNLVILEVMALVVL